MGIVFFYIVLYILVAILFYNFNLYENDCSRETPDFEVYFCYHLFLLVALLLYSKTIL